jgi:aspartate 1-decarboxylase
MAFSIFTEEEAKTFRPRVIVMDENNQIALRK